MCNYCILFWLISVMQPSSQLKQCKHMNCRIHLLNKHMVTHTQGYKNTTCSTNTQAVGTVCPGLQPPAWCITPRWSSLLSSWLMAPVEQHTSPSITSMPLWALHNPVHAHTNSHPNHRLSIVIWPKSDSIKLKEQIIAVFSGYSTEKWATLEETTQTACHVSVYLQWLVLFLAPCIHLSAGMRVIYYHLPCQSSPWYPPSISYSLQHCPLEPNPHPFLLTEPSLPA